MSRQRLYKPYCWVIIALGGASCLASALRLHHADLDGGFLLLAFVTATLASRISIKLPRVNGHITVSDTFIFLTMLLYGGEAAVLLAAADGVCASLKVSKKPFTFAFNAAVFALSTYVTVCAVRFFFHSATGVPHLEVTGAFLTAVCVMALTQYCVNSTLVAVAQAFKTDKTVWHVWSNYCFWNSITHMAGAVIAGGVAKLIHAVGFFSVLITAPIVAIVYLTYRMYLKSIEATASAAKAEEAERHIAELSHHIAEQRRTAERLQESEEYFRNAFDCAAIGMALVSTEGRWLKVNRSLCEIVGYAEGELLAGKFQSITYPDDLGPLLVNIHHLVEGRISSHQMEKRYLHKLGHTVWVLLSFTLVRHTGGKPPHLVFQIQDITDRKRAEERLVHDAFHDNLTGLPNRALFADHLQMAINRYKRSARRAFAVLFLDLDRFKIINDSLGHMVGDQLLIDFARRLETCLRPGDTVARLGGDEFTILLEDIEGADDATAAAERIKRELDRPFSLKGQEVYATASIGIALSADGYDRAEDILRDADTAMYRAKALGKMHYEVFVKTMHSNAMNTLQLETDLRRALERGELFLHYQPIVSLATGALRGFEALARWRHPSRGLVPPTEFIPLAEETGLIIPLGEWVLREACAQMSRWQERLPEARDLSMSVNLSSKQFVRSDLIEQIKATLAETGLRPQNLKLEITESTVMENIEPATEVLRQLRALGVQLAIDDFGTGYSSLSYLHRFPLNTLKIDRSFVTRMAENAENVEIVRTIVMLARNLGLDVVAEGVETHEQLSLLRDLACENGQGYLFSKPAGTDEAEQLIRHAAPDQHGRKLTLVA